MKKIAIIGGAGLAGKELVRLLTHHPELKIVHITSDSVAGKNITEVFKDLPLPKTDLRFSRHEEELPQEALVVLTVPNQAALDMVPELLKKGHRVVDFSGAFRLHDIESFKQFYKLEQSAPDTLAKAVFGLPEIFREQIKKANLVANPGCYPTSVILPLFTLGDLRKDMLMINTNSGSGVSGAGGRTEDAGFSFNTVAENYRAYKILSHQHEPEIIEYGMAGANHRPEIVFTPHLLPLYRGILSTTTILFQNKPEEKKIEQAFAKLETEPFVRFYKTPEEIHIKNVTGTNFLDISWKIRGKSMVLVSAIDNLIKGASGQALQNINLMLDFPETTGLL